MAKITKTEDGEIQSETVNPATETQNNNTPAVPLQASCNVIVRITAGRVRVGTLIAAKGAELVLTQAQADNLIKDNQAVKIGVA